MNERPPHLELRAWRGIHRYSQAEAGRILGCGRDYVRDLETWSRVPNLTVAVRIRDLVGIDPAAWLEPHDEVE
jgi:DNA-binding XRE family transcriptional regulator